MRSVRAISGSGGGVERTKLDGLTIKVRELRMMVNGRASVFILCLLMGMKVCRRPRIGIPRGTIGNRPDHNDRWRQSCYSLCLHVASHRGRLNPIRSRSSQHQPSQTVIPSFERAFPRYLTLLSPFCRTIHLLLRDPPKTNGPIKT